MFTREGLTQFYRDTHQRLDLVIHHAAQLPEGLLTRELDQFGRSSVAKQLAHVLSTDSLWICGLRNQPMIPVPDDTGADMASLLRAKSEVMHRTLHYLASLPEEQLNTNISDVPKEWVGPIRSPAFIVLHIITHYFHHKGQVAAMFRILGHPIGDTDLQRS